jgi:hypothetical protein
MFYRLTRFSVKQARSKAAFCMNAVHNHLSALFIGKRKIKKLSLVKMTVLRPRKKAQIGQHCLNGGINYGRGTAV